MQLANVVDLGREGGRVGAEFHAAVVLKLEHDDCVLLALHEGLELLVLLLDGLLFDDQSGSVQVLQVLDEAKHEAKQIIFVEFLSNIDRKLAATHLLG